jgi:hypothetical protein
MKSIVRRLLTAGRRVGGLALVAGLTVAFGLQAGELPDRDEYAYGFPLVVSGDADYFALDVPLEVYRSVTDTQLRDIGVYNGEGQPVPRQVERPAAATERSEREILLGLIPLYGGQAEQSEQLRLLLLQDSDRTRLELDTERVDAEEPRQALTGYLVDAREMEHTLQALALSWPPLAEGFISTVRLETSDDLQHWRHLGSAALADLQFEETRIEQKRLPLTRAISDYLRISWREMPEGWRLDAVSGFYAGESPPLARRWLELDSVSEDGEPGESAAVIQFHAGGYPPVDSVGVLLPEDNVVLRASIHYRPAGQDNWRQAYNGVFYKLSRQGNTVQSPAAAIGNGRSGPIRAAHWQVRIESGRTAGPVRLQLGWRPDRLLFLAQGTPPFELAAGRAQDALQQFPQEAVLGDSRLFTILRETGEPGDASLGARRIIAGEAGLAISETVSWKVVLVWAGLIAAVLVVGWLVYSLVRENRA